MNPKGQGSNGRILVSLIVLLCSLLIANIAIMVRNQPTVGRVEAVMEKQHESPEDSSMKKGLFREDNTVPPKEEKVLPLFNLKHKTAIVSGAGAGIGLAVAQGFAEAGADVAIWYHGNKEAINKAKEIEETYGVKCMKL